MAGSRSSKQWLQNHRNDTYVKAAQAAGYRSRAAYKLLAIQKKDRLIKRGHRVVDLGAAPGGWTQVLVELVGASGQVYALDRVPMAAVNGAEFLQVDINELAESPWPDGVNVVLSDMAPDLTGVTTVDQARIYQLAGLALDFAEQQLKPGGSFLVKVFQGEGFDDYRRLLLARFKKVVTRKPDASRAQSREVYLVARELTL